jgi:hypothetical protein
MVKPHPQPLLLKEKGLGLATIKSASPAGEGYGVRLK